mmetsp:Transcript_24203/g.38696  ORF Transcript_24203/g.38696 Transcript_24203/m.38696 type:complete len:134 (+) Transcript_24203:61-462(+)|eukprot:CAMPEP_0169098834 /NCGR_PEP_ID=MMETSP1015-20121227/20248_1 /TAXON_ID=342587 /ORGANISM="Karlodinium micrum, Strain CCMP2283" /LENGTH=133 /DNA_ID=CAMNT_0009159701 /DNA_START=55 /DNA_END=456 /DNA_ORIENTATION=-
MAVQASFSFNGKEFQLWTEGQLTALNRDALKKRCMDIRDGIGQDNLPRMPHHPEGMVAWMLEVQNAATGRGRPSYSGQKGGVSQVPESSADVDYQREYMPSGEQQTEAQVSYREAQSAAKAIQQRNRGGDGLW